MEDNCKLDAMLHIRIGFGSHMVLNNPRGRLTFAKNYRFPDFYLFGVKQHACSEHSIGEPR